MKITELVQSVEQAANRLGLTPETIRRRCFVGSIPLRQYRWTLENTKSEWD